MENTYIKFAPNVFVAKCINEHEKGEVITMTTKYGKEHDAIVFNLVGKKDNCNLYSVIRADGMNYQEFMKRKSERFEKFAQNAEKRADHFYQASKEGADFLSLGEPIKVGHHSENRHRKLIERNWNRMGKSVAESEKAEQLSRKAEYYEKMAENINLSMPESIDFYSFEYDKAVKYHSDLKSGKIPPEHSFSLTYAKKKVNTLKKQLDLAIKLWGE